MKSRASLIVVTGALLLGAVSLSHAASTTPQTQNGAQGAMMAAGTAADREGANCVDDGRVRIADRAAFVCHDGKLATVFDKQWQAQAKAVAVSIELTFARPGGVDAHTMAFITQDGSRAYVDEAKETRSVSGGIKTGLSVRAVPTVLPDGRVDLYMRVSDSQLESPGDGVHGRGASPVVAEYSFEGQTIVKPGIPTLLLRRGMDDHPLEVTVKVKLLDNTAPAAS
jgi:hypothetical protein